MASIFDVSKYILEHFDQPISPHKLQKLTYLSQGWSLALTDKPIFSEDFEAWAHGPINRELFNTLRGIHSINGTDGSSTPSPDRAKSFGLRNIPKG